MENYSEKREFRYLTQDVIIEGEKNCKHEWVENEDYDNGDIKEIICKFCGQYEVAVKEYEEKKEMVFNDLYKKFHEKIEPFEPIVFKNDNIFDDYVNLTYIRGYVLDKGKTNVFYMEKELRKAGLEVAEIGFESSYFVIGVKLGETRTGVIDLNMDYYFDLSKQEIEENDKIIIESLKTLGFEEEIFSKLEIKSYVIGNYSY